MMVILILVFFVQFAFIFYLYETINEMESELRYLESYCDLLKKHFLNHLYMENPLSTDKCDFYSEDIDNSIPRESI